MKVYEIDKTNKIIYKQIIFITKYIIVWDSKLLT